MQEDFLALLRGDAQLAALLERHHKKNRPLIDWVERPDTSRLPAMTLTTIDELDDLNQDGPIQTIASRVQMDFWGADSQTRGGGYGQTRLAYRRVKNKFQPVNGIYPRFTQGNTLFKQVVYDSSRDLPPTDLPGGVRAFHLESDFIVWHRRIA